MILGGDELGRTQAGNNNAYCQDGPISWFDWEAADTEFLTWCRDLIKLRRDHPVFRRRRWFQRHRIRGSQEIAWLRPDGEPMSDNDWENGYARAIGVLLDGEAISTPDRFGGRVARRHVLRHVQRQRAGSAVDAAVETAPTQRATAIPGSCVSTRHCATPRARACRPTRPVTLLQRSIIVIRSPQSGVGMTARARFDVCVVGSSNVDLVVATPRHPAPGETLLGSSYHEYPGGKGLNQVVAATRAGGAAAFVSALGDDAAGDQLAEVLGGRGHRRRRRSTHRRNSDRPGPDHRRSGRRELHRRDFRGQRVAAPRSPARRQRRAQPTGDPDRRRRRCLRSGSRPRPTDDPQSGAGGRAARRAAHELLRS